LFSHDTVDPSVPGLDPQSPPVPPPFATGLQEFCFATPDGQEEPTLHVWPGDQLIIHVKNNAPSSLVFEPDQTIDFNQAPGEVNTPQPALNSPCFAAITTPASTNDDSRHGKMMLQ